MRAIAGRHIGDLVQAEDPRTGKVEAEPILAVIDDGVKPLLAVGLSDGSTVRVTANHPFWVDSGAALAAPGWLPAGEVRAGDRLRTEDGRDVAVLGICEGAGSAHVYILTVAHDPDTRLRVFFACIQLRAASPSPTRTLRRERSAQAHRPRCNQGGGPSRDVKLSCCFVAPMAGMSPATSIRTRRNDHHRHTPHATRHTPILDPCCPDRAIRQRSGRHIVVGVDDLKCAVAIVG